MKVKIKMTCILKSGVKVTETIRVHRTDTKVFKAIEAMQKQIEDSCTLDKSTGCITFGKTTIQLSEIAAISFKD